MIDLDYSIAISKIETYAMDRPVDKDLRKQSYSEWAIDEILSRLILETEKDPTLLSREGIFTPEDVVMSFYMEMEYLEDTSDTLRQRFIFGIARQEADRILAIM